MGKDEKIERDIESFEDFEDFEECYGINRDEYDENGDLKELEF